MSAARRKPIDPQLQYQLAREERSYRREAAMSVLNQVRFEREEALRDIDTQLAAAKDDPLPMYRDAYEIFEWLIAVHHASYRLDPRLNDLKNPGARLVHEFLYGAKDRLITRVAAADNLLRR